MKAGVDALRHQEGPARRPRLGRSNRVKRDHPEIIGLGRYGGVGGAGRLCAQRLIEAATGQAHRARRTVARGRDACRVVGTSNRSRASVDARAASGLFQTRSRIPLIERGDQRVELTGRDQSLVRAAEHAIGLVRRRRKDECRDRRPCPSSARDPLLARRIRTHLDPSGPGSHSPHGTVLVRRVQALYATSLNEIRPPPTDANRFALTSVGSTSTSPCTR